ncbi:Retrovirus-related Pol polyprotein from transposon TNT 1-94 [Dendrobium catenatum]|uniref:Retrovirus-related Pol polyprotein from transposon TNT 1-94 n=1 Tax=Dendrobium catenatum TaxID=906689 RepID=A0A2I0X5Q4_9ASPA|nr:Retrovirus-related Pol polyprotein from transposon TNT 1-94 [Dendrobium catenatum]
MSAEFMALQQQGTWSLVPPPPNKIVLGSKWIFKLKTTPDGQIDRYKARLVAQGFKQEFGLNFNETFSPVAKLPTIRILLLLALQRHWPTLQLDISNAFLHGDLQEEVFMKQPPGFIDSQQPDYVCKLHKSLYGLRQAPRQWYNKLTQSLIQFGFIFSKADPSLLIFTKSHIQLYLLIYVDDLLLTGNDSTTIDRLLAMLRTQFSLKQLGTIGTFLGIQVHRNASTITLHQTKYAKDILTAAGFTNSKPVPTPSLLKSTKHNSAAPTFSDPQLYRRLVGSLNYLTITRPDIAFAVNAVCQHMHNPSTADFLELKRILRYIQGTLDFGLPLQPGNLQLTTYVDADWAADATDRKSVSGFCSFLGSTLVSWSVKKQTTVAKSSTEAEYRALASATSDILWLRRLIAEFGITQTGPTTIFCDSVSAIALAHNPVFHARTKHIEIDYHFISHHIQQGDIAVRHLHSLDQTADILTKSLSPTRFHFLRDKLTICSTNAQFEGGC